jgi:hypothetical protein
MGLSLGRVDSMWTRAWMVVTRERENRRGTWDAGRAGSVGRERMLVGCGCGSGTDAGWVWMRVGDRCWLGVVLPSGGYSQFEKRYYPVTSSRCCDLSQVVSPSVPNGGLSRSPDTRYTAFGT